MSRWAEVAGYGGRYEISDGGVVRSARGALKPNACRGYQRVTLRSEGKGRNRSIHRLVAEAFLGNPPSAAHQVNHVNGDRADNRVANLEWVTPGQNVRHAYSHLGRQPMRGERHPNSKLTDAQVLEIFSSPESPTALGRLYETHWSVISNIKNGKRWQHLTAAYGEA